MLFGETVAVYCENHTEHTDTVRTSQETHYISATEPNRLMLFGETVAVYCENHTEHTDTVRTSQETHYVSATEPNRLMLLGETVAVYCENHTEHTGVLKHVVHIVTSGITNVKMFNICEESRQSHTDARCWNPAI
jgi:thioredoxin-related protein